MEKKFENKTLNKEDHKKVEKQADIIRGGVLTLGILGIAITAIKKFPLKNIKDTVQTYLRKV